MIRLNNITEIDTYYETILLDIVSVYSTSEKVAINGRDTCSHSYTDEETLRCSTCGAWVGHIGEEYDDSLFYKHIYYIANMKKADSIIILSDRYYPDDYELEVFQGYTVKKQYKYSRTYTITTKLNTFSSRFSRSEKNSYIIHMTNNKKDLWKSSIIFTRKSLEDIALTMLKGNTLYLNSGSCSQINAETITHVILDSDCK
ncbi:hypothetical protein ThvES_00020060 [Thiovulum sp. ES]|nr:hypothetical protein ThvES_00020060 [Thiovulum sp. ES]